MRLLWRIGTEHLSLGLTAALARDAVDDSKLDDLNMSHDKYILDLYRVAAESQGMTVREFLLKYKLATIREKKSG